MSEAKKNVSPWTPIKEAIDLKILGKLSEELGELSQVVARCIIQGIHEQHPETGKSNKLWLEEEFADVYANLYLAARRFELDGDFIADRADEKVGALKQWHKMA